METPQYIVVALEKIKNFIIERQILLDEIPKVLKREIPKILDEYFENRPLLQPIKPIESNEASIIDLLHSSTWPEAVDPKLIVTNSDEQKTARAEGILDFIVSKDPKNKKFLDFGCGEGFVAAVASKYQANLSIGYDIKKPEDKWKKDNLIFTDSIAEISKHAPYDIIVLFDVLDHVEGITAEELLKLVYSVSNETTEVFVRCHPWIGRHGSDIYRNLNKAFVHLALNDSQLKELNIEIPTNCKVSSPLSTYKSWANTAGFKVKKISAERQQVEPFFLENKTVSEELKKLTVNGRIPKDQMEICFVDMILVK